VNENTAVRCVRASVTLVNIVLQRVRADSGDKRNHLVRCHLNNFLPSHSPQSPTPSVTLREAAYEGPLENMHVTHSINECAIWTGSTLGTAIVREMYVSPVVTKAKACAGRRKEKDASHDKCRKTERAQFHLVLSIHGSMPCSDDMNNTEIMCHKGKVPRGWRAQRRRVGPVSHSTGGQRIIGIADI